MIRFWERLVHWRRYALYLTFLFMNGFWWNFQDRLAFIQGTIDEILRKIDEREPPPTHYHFFVLHYIWIGRLRWLGGGLRSVSALVLYIVFHDTYFIEKNLSYFSLSGLWHHFKSFLLQLLTPFSCVRTIFHIFLSFSIFHP